MFTFTYPGYNYQISNFNYFLRGVKAINHVTILYLQYRIYNIIFQISYLRLTNLTCPECFSWNEGIDTCFNVECVLFGRNFDCVGGYLVVTAR